MIGFLSRIERLPRAANILLCMANIILLGWLDWASGFELSFSFFYLLPVAIATWGLGRSAGLVVSGFSAITWVFSNVLAGEMYTNNLIAVWNAWMRAGFFVVVTVLLDSLKIALQEERKLARTDGLTGVLNRKAFLEQLEIQLKKTRFSPKPCTLVYFDLDNFKELNDSLGHTAGDEALGLVTTTMIESIRQKDLAARLGGDEFALMLCETERTDAEKIVARLQTTLVSKMQQRGWPITLSIGGITFLKPVESVEQMISLADDVMYRVKKSGKNSCLFVNYPE